MNPTEVTHKLIRAWMRAHVECVSTIVRRLKAVTDSPIGQPFNGEDEEYLVTKDGIGYHVVKELDINNGILQIHGVPGRFVPSNVGAIWVNGKHWLHDEIERRCDQKEDSLLIQ